MGISGFYPFLEKMIPNCSKSCRWEYFEGKRIAFDGKSLLYRFLYGNKSHSHILQYGQFYANLIRKGIDSVFIFDGKSPEKKAFELAKREERKNK